MPDPGRDGDAKSGPRQGSHRRRPSRSLSPKIRRYSEQAPHNEGERHTLDHGARYFGDCSPSNWFFRPLEGLPKHAVVDANVLLDACLIVDGLGSAVLVELARTGTTLHTSERATEEVRSALRRGLDGHKDLTPLVDMMVKSAPISVHASEAHVPGIAAHDRHVAAVAAKVGGFVVSEDLPLLLELDAAEIHARSLRELMLAIVCKEGQPRQELSVFGQGAGADGHIFAKFFAHPDMVADRSRPWFLFDAPAFGSLHYDGPNRSFVFSTEAGDIVAMHHDLRSDVQYSFVLNYSVGNDTRITMKLRSFGSDGERCAHGCIPALQARPTGSITILNSRNKNVGWKGDLQSFTFGPYQLGKKTWRAASRLVGVSPPTLTCDLTFLAATLTEIKGDQVRRPQWMHVLELNHVTIPGFYPGRRVDERPDGNRWFE